MSWTNRIGLISFETHDRILVRYNCGNDFVMGAPMDNSPAKLSIEQQFAIASFRAQVDRMSREQAQEAVLYLYEQLMLRENSCKAILKEAWGLGAIAGLGGVMD